MHNRSRTFFFSFGKGGLRNCWLSTVQKKKKKSEGRCPSAPAKFTVIGKLFVGGKGIEGRTRGTGLDEEGRRGKAPSYKVLKLLCLSYEFPSITIGGENSRKGQERAGKQKGLL